MDDFDDWDIGEPTRSDRKQGAAREELRSFINARPNEVFFSRQLAIIFEKTYLHWITYRALQDLLAERLVQKEIRTLSTGTTLHLYWHRSNRYYKRRANQVTALVEEYASPSVTREVGYRGEELVIEAFARCQFILRGRHARSYLERTWTLSDHTLDFIFERDGIAYGIEVKNTLPYMEREDFDRTIAICRELNIRCVHVIRRNPEPWLLELREIGGFTLMLDYQLYPPLLEDLVDRVCAEHLLPFRCPRALWEGTMQRFLGWHNRNRTE